MKRKIILASKSPRRKSLLEQIGLRFDTRESKYEEDMEKYSDPYKLVKYLALKKAEDVARHYKNAIIIGADTVVIVKNKIVGKPKDAKEAKNILEDVSGKKYTVLSGYAVIDTKNKKAINGVGEAKVEFKKLSNKEIDSYISTGEPFDKAGGFGIQNVAAVFIEGVQGDFYSIVGLPLNKIYEALKRMGVDVLEKL